MDVVKRYTPIIGVNPTPKTEMRGLPLMGRWNSFRGYTAFNRLRGQVVAQNVVIAINNKELKPDPLASKNEFTCDVEEDHMYEVIRYPVSGLLEVWLC